MGRKVERVPISEEGRDHGKVFVLTEMPATVGKRWVTTLTSLLARQGVPLSGDWDDPVVSVAVAGVLDDPSLIRWRECVQYEHRANHPLQAILWDEPICQIEEIATVTLLQVKVAALHVGFFSPASPSISGLPSTTTPRVS